MFAFRNSARRLRHHALNVSYKPLTLTDGLLPDFLLRLADGMVVAIAVPSRLPATVRGEWRRRLHGHWRTARTAAHGEIQCCDYRQSRQSDGAVVRSGSAAIDLHIAAGRETAEIQEPPAHPVSRSSPETGEAAIRQGSRDIVRTAEGAAVAVWTPQGRLAHAFVLQARDAFRVPIATGPLSVYPLRGLWSGQELAV